MKLTNQRQLFLTFVIAILFNLMNALFSHWIFSSIGKCICGLIWVIHPVLPEGDAATEKQRNIIRLVGVLIIIYGVFSRLYLY